MHCISNALKFNWKKKKQKYRKIKFIFYEMNCVWNVQLSIQTGFPLNCLILCSMWPYQHKIKANYYSLMWNKNRFQFEYIIGNYWESSASNTTKLCDCKWFFYYKFRKVTASWYFGFIIFFGWLNRCLE